MEATQDFMERVAKLLNITKITGLQQSQTRVSQNKYDCEICKEGRGWILNIETNIASPCKCQEVSKYKKSLDESGITEAFLQKTFSTYKPKSTFQAMAKTKAIEYSKEFEKIKSQPNNSIAFLGQVGCGKTHISIAISNNLIKQSIGVIYMQYREAIMTLKQNVIDEATYQKEINKYKQAPVLLIDDLFKGKITEADINLMYEIINYRYLKQMPIIVSSEYNTDKLLEYDEAIGSRIIEMCKGNIFEFEGINLNHRLE